MMFNAYVSSRGKVSWTKTVAMFKKDQTKANLSKGNKFCSYDTKNNGFSPTFSTFTPKIESNKKYITIDF